VIALVLTAVFAAGAAGKAAAPWQFLLTVRELLPGRPRWQAKAVAIGMPALELAIAVCYTAGPRPFGVLASQATLLAAGCFAAAYLLARRQPQPISCHCFGTIGSGRLTGSTVVVAAVLAVTALSWTALPGALATFNQPQLRILGLLPAAVLLLVAQRQPSRPTHHSGSIERVAKWR
jgi:hypothetical protein